MSKNKIVEHLEAHRARRIAPPSMLEWNTSEKLKAHPDILEVKVDISIGAFMQGPYEDINDMKHEMTSLLVHELYGDIERELWQLRKLMSKHIALRYDDALNQQFRKLQEMVRP